jgi:hypothetical protein
MECEYGNDPTPACNETISCTASGWSFPPPTVQCQPGMCPASYAAVPQGKSCSPPGLGCAYPEGQCNCSSSLPVAGGPLWLCSMPAPVCPEPRPRLGAPCSQPDLSCDYGACTGGIALKCTDGYWHRAQVLCPG